MYEYTTHITDCRKCRCSRCYRKIFQDEYFERLRSCPYYRCRRCKKRFNKHPEQLSQHLNKCERLVLLRCCMKKASSDQVQYHIDCQKRKCPACRKLYHVDEIAERLRICQPLSLTKTLLAPTTCYPTSSSIERIMNDWINTPLTTVIADFEYLHQGSSYDHQAVFEFAMANAHAEWVVPVTTINHRISIRELFEKQNSFDNSVKRLIWASSVSKYYGAIDDTETPGPIT